MKETLPSIKDFTEMSKISHIGNVGYAKATRLTSKI